MIDDQPINTHIIVEMSRTYQSVIIILIAVFMAALLQITILNQTNKIATNLNNMTHACLVVAEKEKP